MSEPTIINVDVPEGTTPRLTFTVLDDAGAQVQPNTCTLTVYDEHTGSVLGTEDTDVIGSITGGAADIRLDVAHTAMQGTGRYEWHRAFFEFEYGIGGVGKHEVRFRVHNLTKFP